MFKKFFLLLITLLFISNPLPLRAEEGADWKWTSLSTIQSREFDMVFNKTVTVPDLYKEHQDQYSGLQYYYFASNKFAKGTKIPLFLAVDKGAPTKGFLMTPMPRGSAIREVLISTTPAANPVPLKKITKGAIWGTVSQLNPKDWQATDFEKEVVGRSVTFETDDGSPVNFSSHSGGNEGRIDPEHKFARFKIYDAEGLGGLYEGRYRIEFHHDQLGDCDSGGTEGADPLCGVALNGVLNFDLIATSNGEGLVKVVGGDESDKNERAATPGDGINTKEMDDPSGSPKLVMNIKYKKTNPFDSAIESAMQNMIDGLKNTILVMSGWVKTILDKGNFINEPGIIDAWTRVRNLGLGLLTLGLLIIAFANILSIDIERYGLNRMIPKLVIAIVMTYFSFLIANFLLELASAFQEKLIGSASYDFAAKITTITETGSEAFGTGATLVLNAILGILLFVIIVVALLYLCLVLIVRIAVIWFLVAVAPLAFLMQVMPFSESLYKQWWKKFWSWVFMGPAIAFMLWLTTVMLDAFGTQFDSGGAWLILLLAAACIFMAAAIPMQMGGDIYKAIQSAGKKYGTKVPGVKHAQEWIKQSKATGESRRKLGVQRARTNVALKGGLAGRLATGSRKKDIATLQGSYIKDRAEQFKTLNNTQLKETFERDWDKMSSLDRRALFRTMLEKKALPDAVNDEHPERAEAWKKIAADRDLWVNDQEIFGTALKEAPDIFAKMGNAGVVFDKEDKIGTGKQLSVGMDLSLSKKASDWKPEQVKWMAKEGNGAGNAKLLNALKSKSTVNDIMMGNNQDLQKEIGKFLHNPDVVKELVPHIVDDDHRQGLGNMEKIGKAAIDKDAADAANRAGHPQA